MRPTPALLIIAALLTITAPALAHGSNPEAVRVWVVPEGPYYEGDTITIYAQVQDHTGNPVTPFATPELQLSWLETHEWPFHAQHRPTGALDQMNATGSLSYFYNWTLQAPGQHDIIVWANTGNGVPPTWHEGNAKIQVQDDALEVQAVEIDGLDSGSLLEVGIWGILLVVSLWRGWWGPAIVATMAIPWPLINGEASQFRWGVLAAVIFFWLTWWAHRRSLETPEGSS